MVLIILPVNQYGTLDDISKEYTEAGFKRALVTYAVVRGLNGIISVAQGTEIAVEPVGIGLTFKPGEILDPVNDLVERFSWIVLASGTSLGIQKVLLNAGTWHWFRVAVSLILVTTALLLWTRGEGSRQVRVPVIRLALIVILLRFSVPVLTYGNELFYRHFLEPEYQVSSEKLKQTSLTLGDLNSKTQSEVQEEEGFSLFENARRLYRSTADRINIEERIRVFREAAENISEHTLNLIVIFVLQTLLIPLFYIWILLQLLKYFASGNLRLGHTDQD